MFAVLFIGLSILISGCSSPKRTAEKNAFPEEALGWKLGAQAYTFKKFTFTEAIEKIASCDLRYVEAYPGQEIGGGQTAKIDHRMSPENLQYVKKLLKEKGIHWSAYGVVKAKDPAEWRQVFEFAKSMGIETITCEPNIDMIDDVSKLCDEFNIRAAIHNHASPSYYWKPETVLEAIAGKSEKLGAAGDIGHWLKSGLDPLECLKKLEGKVFHLHFKDLNDKANKQAHDVHWGNGVADVAAVIAELKRQQFDGMIAAEYEYNWDNNAEDVRISVQNFRRFVSIPAQ